MENQTRKICFPASHLQHEQYTETVYIHKSVSSVQTLGHQQFLYNMFGSTVHVVFHVVTDANSSCFHVFGFLDVMISHASKSVSDKYISSYWEK